MSNFGPSDRYYDPPDPPEACCSEYEDDPDHDWQQCMDDQAEDAAERKYEAMRDAEMDERWYDDD